jgi:predicted dehydrogenase
MDRVRIGILGAARIAPMALVTPARAVPEVEVRAIAAREPERARAFARKHGIASVARDYAELIADPSLDAIYNPLPNNLHAEWTIRALEAGKHVLCEKPLTANAPEAERVVAAAQRTGRLCMEAFHWRYHPLAERMLAIIASGELGAVRHIEAWLCYPLLERRNIRWRLDLAGGVLMDAGCYPVSIVRQLAGAEPSVVRAEAKLASPGVDRRMEATFAFADGRTGAITCSMLSRTLFRIEARVVGERGTMIAVNPVLPQFYHRLKVRTARGERREKMPRITSYECQLRAFADAVRHGTPVPTPAEDGLDNMRVIDAIYRAAGLTPRSGSLVAAR